MHYTEKSSGKNSRYATLTGTHQPIILWHKTQLVASIVLFYNTQIALPSNWDFGTWPPAAGYLFTIAAPSAASLPCTDLWLEKFLRGFSRYCIVFKKNSSLCVWKSANAWRYCTNYRVNCRNGCATMTLLCLLVLVLLLS